MNTNCQFLSRCGGYILWRVGEYAYQITKGVQPFEIIRHFRGDFDDAMIIFDDMTKQK